MCGNIEQKFLISFLERRRSKIEKFCNYAAELFKIKQMHLTFRLATQDDVVDLIQILADDFIRVERDNSSSAVIEKYRTAFEKIQSDSNQELTVVELDGEKVGTFQISYIHYLLYEGKSIALVEAVAVSSKHRGIGIGTKMFEYIINRAKEKGCYLVQLTSNKRRVDAIRFYKSLGFKDSHEGFKLEIH